MSDAKKRKYKLSGGECVKRYGFSISTVARLRRRGVNTDDPRAVKDALAAQQIQPASAAGITFEDVRDDDDPPATGNALADLNAAKLRKTLIECDRLTHKLDVERGLYTRNDELRAELAKLLAETVSALRQAFENETPPKCEGLSAVKIQLVNRDALDRVLLKLSRGVDSLPEEAPEPQSEAGENNEDNTL